MSDLYPRPPSGNEASPDGAVWARQTRPHSAVTKPADSTSVTAQIPVRETVADVCDDLSTTIKKIRGAASWAPAEGLDFAARRILPRLPVSTQRLVGVLGRKAAPTYVSARPDPSVWDVPHGAQHCAAP